MPTRNSSHGSRFANAGFIPRAIAVISLLFFTGVSHAAPTLFFYQRGYVPGGETAATVLTDQALKGFARRHPGIEVTVTGLPWGSEGDLKLRSILMSRKKIDCFRVTNDQLPDYIPGRGELLSPIDDELTPADLQDFMPAALDAIRHKGKIMAWPLWSTALPLVGNARIMKERGIEPTPCDRPWEWSRFLDRLRAGTFKREDGTEVWGLTASARPPFFEWNPLLWAQAGPIFLPPDENAKPGAPQEIRFAPTVAPALRRVAELITLGLVPRSFGTDDQTTAQGQFLSGRATFILCTPAFIRTLAGNRFPYVILPPPLGDYGHPITTGALGCFAVVAHSDEPERTKAAHVFARYLTSAEIAEDVPDWYLAAPVRRSVKAFERNPMYAGLMQIVPTAVYANPPGGAGFMDGTIVPKLQAALMGQITPQQALRDIQDAYARKQSF